MIRATITPSIAAKEVLTLIHWLRPDVVGRGDLAEAFTYGRDVRLSEDQLDSHNFKEFSRCVCLPVATQMAWRFASTPPVFATFKALPFENAVESYNGVMVRVSATQLLKRWPSEFDWGYRFEVLLGHPLDAA
jgi:hypothetical protein